MYVVLLRKTQRKDTSKLIHIPEIIVQEGLFLYTHGLSPYDGGVFYQVKKLKIKTTGGFSL